jgi:hypothetical protein
MSAGVRPPVDRGGRTDGSPVLQYDTAYGCAPLWLECPKLSSVGIGTQIFRVAGLGLPVRMARTADGDDCKKRGDARHYFRRLL